MNIINFYFNQVQSHLTGLTSAVNDLEEWEKQRNELLEWINAQKIIISDWISRPTKLRPEGANQELATMNELLVTIGDKRNLLLNDVPLSCKSFSLNFNSMVNKYVNYNVM